MIKQKQLVKHNPPYDFGDCGSTAIACLLEYPVESVPHFFYDGGREGCDRMDAWLAHRGYRRIQFPIKGDMDAEEVAEYVATHNGNHILWMLVAGTSAGTDHILVMRGRFIACDPADKYTLKDLKPTHADGVWWIEFLVQTGHTLG